MLVVMYAPLRVLVLSDWFPGFPGDTAGNFVRQQALVAARRHEVTVLHLRAPTTGEGRPRLEETTDGPLRVIRLHCGHPAVVTAVNLWAVAATIARLRRDGALPELLHAHETAGGLGAVLAGRALGCPVVVSEHSSEFAHDEFPVVAARIARFAFARADVVCPVSESLRANLEQGEWGGHLRVVPNVIDTDLFRIHAPPAADEPPLILAVAALEPVKGVQDLVEAVGILLSRRADFRVELVGEGSLRATLARRSDELGLGERFLLRGAVPHPVVAKLTGRAAFAVVPSRWETFSVFLGEAMASGLPVVASAVGAMTERVHAGNGVLCPIGDPGALAAALDMMLGRYQTYDRETIAAETHARFSPESIAARWQEVYAEAIERRRARNSRIRRLRTDP